MVFFTIHKYLEFWAQKQSFDTFIQSHMRNVTLIDSISYKQQTVLSNWNKNLCNNKNYDFNIVQLISILKSFWNSVWIIQS